MTATSRRGNERTLKIEAPDMDISSGLTVLPDNFIDASIWMETPCEERIGENISRFSLKGRDAAPTPVNDLGYSPPCEFGNADWDGKASGKGHLDMSVFEDEDK